jgi:hypothetical protein
MSIGDNNGLDRQNDDLPAPVSMSHSASVEAMQTWSSGNNIAAPIVLPETSPMHADAFGLSSVANMPLSSRNLAANPDAADRVMPSAISAGGKASPVISASDDDEAPTPLASPMQTNAASSPLRSRSVAGSVSDASALPTVSSDTQAFIIEMTPHMDAHPQKPVVLAGATHLSAEHQAPVRFSPAPPPPRTKPAGEGISPSSKPNGATLAAVPVSSPASTGLASPQLTKVAIPAPIQAKSPEVVQHDLPSYSDDLLLSINADADEDDDETVFDELIYQPIRRKPASTAHRTEPSPSSAPNTVATVVPVVIVGDSSSDVAASGLPHTQTAPFDSGSELPSSFTFVAPVTSGSSQPDDIETRSPLVLAMATHAARALTTDVPEITLDEEFIIDDEPLQSDPEPVPASAPPTDPSAWAVDTSAIAPVDEDVADVEEQEAYEDDDLSLGPVAQFLLSFLEGLVHKKHGRWGRPHNRLIWLDTTGDNLFLCWGKPDEGIYAKKATAISLGDVISVQVGMNTKILKSSGKKADESKYWSIITVERSIDLEAPDTDERDFCAIQLSRLMKEPGLLQTTLLALFHGGHWKPPHLNRAK